MRSKTLPTQCAVQVSVIQSTCLWTTTQSTHTDIHIRFLESSFKGFYTSYTNWTRKPNNSPLLPLKRGENNLKYHNQRHECSIRTSCFSKCHGPTHFCWLFHESLSSDRGHTGATRLCLSTTEETLSNPKCQKCCWLSCLVRRNTAQLNVRGLGLQIVQTLLKKMKYIPTSLLLQEGSKQSLKNFS